MSKPLMRKALSIRQPWANLIVDGKKTIEIREWDTWYRGVLFIHAGKKYDSETAKRLDTPYTPLGAVIGEAELVHIKMYREFAEWYEDYLAHLNPYDWFRPGVYGWVFENPKRYDAPVRMRGELGLFPVRTSKVLPDD